MSDGRFLSEARQSGKSARTRARLMDAAVSLFAKDGFAAVSANEIARQADVANGTFYVHFRDRDEIGAMVAFAIAQRVVRQLDELMADVDDAVERTSLATRRFIDLGVSEPDWGRALFHAVWRFPDLRSNVTAYLRADLERGVEQGAFKTEVDDFLIDMFASLTLSALYGRLQGEYGPEAGAKTAELQLRMLGVAPARAKKAAWRALPPSVWTELPIAGKNVSRRQGA